MNETEGFILAGGASSRMKQDKAHLRLDDKTFIERAAIALNKIAKQIFIVGSLPIEKSSIEFPSGETRDLLVLADVYKSNSRAAIIGLHTAFVHCKTDWAAIVACDLPFVTGELLARLTSFRDEKFDAVVPLQTDGKMQPLCAFYRRETCLPIVEKLLDDGDWKLRELPRRVRTRFVEFDNLSDLSGSEHFFFNVNTPADHANAKAAFKLPGSSEQM